MCARSEFWQFSHFRWLSSHSLWLSLSLSLHLIYDIIIYLPFVKFILTMRSPTIIIITINVSKNEVKLDRRRHRKNPATFPRIVCYKRGRRRRQWRRTVLRRKFLGETSISHYYYYHCPCPLLCLFTLCALDLAHASNHIIILLAKHLTNSMPWTNGNDESKTNVIPFRWWICCFVFVLCGCRDLRRRCLHRPHWSKAQWDHVAQRIGYAAEVLSMDNVIHCRMK